MMTTFRQLAIIMCLMLCSSTLFGGQCSYNKAGVKYIVTETGTDYVVAYDMPAKTSSRAMQLAESRIRMDALDLVGTYILFKDFAKRENLSEEYFPIFYDGTELHYTANVKDFVMDKVNCRCVCPKNEYDISAAQYNSDINLPGLMLAYYSKRKCAESASLIYHYKGLDFGNYLALYRDFLNGETILPSRIRSIQRTQSRLELSSYQDDSTFRALVLQSKNELPETMPYRMFCQAELVTSAAAEDKPELYKEWADMLGHEYLLEDLLLFCSKKCSTPAPDEANLTEIIEAYPGAISATSLNLVADAPAYAQAAEKYAGSQFADAEKILKDEIDLDFTTSCAALNLIGGALRFQEKPAQAMPYLLMAFFATPETPYVVGNIVLCMKELKYKRIEELISALKPYAKDNWSIGILTGEI